MPSLECEKISDIWNQFTLNSTISTSKFSRSSRSTVLRPVSKPVISPGLMMRVPGKGDGIHTVMEIVHELNSKAVCFVDGDLLSIKGEWIEEMIRPVLYGRTDLVVPFYVRDKFDGVITNNLLHRLSMEAI